MDFFKHVSDESRFSREIFESQNRTMKLVTVSLFSCLAAIFQAAGGFFPIAGYLISPLATAPVMLCSMFSPPVGIACYFLTIILLLIIQPAELIIFPFTTGLLGLGIGLSFQFFKRKVTIIAASAFILLAGIMCLLYIFQFPVLGPFVPASFSFFTAGGLLLFACLYSWIWVEIGIIIVKRLRNSVRRFWD